jgi:hypothetical protein
MTQSQVIELEQGPWIQPQWLKEAGLNDKVQIVIQEGEIRLLRALATSNLKEEEGWEMFLSLEKDAPTGQITDVSANYDNYLYQK